MKIFGGQNDDTLNGSAAADEIHGNAGNDRLRGGGGDDVIFGGDGIDTAFFTGNRLEYLVGAVSADRVLVMDNVPNRDGLDFATVERVSFADVGLAYDFAGNAGKVAKLVTAVFGADALANKSLVSAGLKMLDGGMSYQQLADAALTARLGAQASDAAVVELLYTNVVGTPPPAQVAGEFQGMLASGALTSGGLAVLVAECDLNKSHVQLTGVTVTGLEFVV